MKASGGGIIPLLLLPGPTWLPDMMSENHENFEILESGRSITTSPSLRVGYTTSTRQDTTFAFPLNVGPCISISLPNDKNFGRSYLITECIKSTLHNCRQLYKYHITYFSHLSKLITDGACLRKTTAEKTFHSRVFLVNKRYNRLTTFTGVTQKVGWTKRYTNLFERNSPSSTLFRSIRSHHNLYVTTCRSQKLPKKSKWVKN